MIFALLIFILPIFYHKKWIQVCARRLIKIKSCLTNIFLFQQASLLNAQNKRRRRQQEQEDREQLLSRRFGHDHTAINVDFLGQEHNSLQSSHQHVDEMLHTGVYYLTYIMKIKI